MNFYIVNPNYIEYLRNVQSHVKIAKSLKEYINPILDKVASNMDFT